MQFDGAGTPRVEISTDRSRSDKVTVMPAADPCETTFVTVKMDNISSMCSPDHHKAPPTRTTDLKSPETSTRVEQPSRFSQDGACSSSSSTCAEAEHSNAHSQSGSELDWDDSDSAGRIEDEMSGGSSGEDTMAAQGRVSNSTNESSKTCNGHSAHLQVLFMRATTSLAGQTALEFTPDINVQRGFVSPFRFFCSKHDATYHVCTCAR